MSELAILGAGDLGGALAHRAASRARFRRIWLIDPEVNVAAGKALDILQACPIENVTTQVAGASIAQAAAADVLVVADRFGAPAREWEDAEGLAVLVEAAAVASRAAIVCAGARQRALVERAVREGGIPRYRVLGSAPEALAAAARVALALTLDCSALDARLSVAGVLPEQPVVLWSAATGGAMSLGTQLTPSDRARVAGMLPFLWPPAPYALASAACRVAESVAASAHAEYMVWAYLEGEFGVPGAVAAVPARLSARGVDRVSTTACTVGERDEIARSVTAHDSVGR